MKYALLARVNDRGTADVIVAFLKADEIDAVLVQEAISHLTHPTSFAPVEIFVPKLNFEVARSLLMAFYKAQDNSKEINIWQIKKRSKKD